MINSAYYSAHNANKHFLYLLTQELFYTSSSQFLVRSTSQPDTFLFVFVQNCFSSIIVAGCLANSAAHTANKHQKAFCLLWIITKEIIRASISKVVFFISPLAGTPQSSMRSPHTATLILLLYACLLFYNQRFLGPKQCLAISLCCNYFIVSVMLIYHMKCRYAIFKTDWHSSGRVLVPLVRTHNSGWVFNLCNDL